MTSVYQLTDAATITPDFGLASPDMGQMRSVFAVTLGGNRTLANPLNPRDGVHLVLRVTQDATGGRTLAFGTAFAFSAPQSRPSPVLSIQPGASQEMVFGYASGAAQWWLVQGPYWIDPGSTLVWPSYS